MEKNIDRLYIVSHAGKCRIRPMKFRYLSKSIFASCKGDGEAFEYINFRGRISQNVRLKMPFSKDVIFGELRSKSVNLAMQYFKIVYFRVVSSIAAIFLVLSFSIPL